MAEGKNSFVLYADYIGTFEELTDDEAGKLIKHLFRYVNDENPVTDDKLIKIAFEPIKQQLKRDLQKWAEKKTGFSDAGKESGKVRRLAAPQVYVLRFYNSEEEFIKVGITDLSVGRRYSSSGDGGSKLGYKFDILHQYFPKENESLTEIESMIAVKFKEHSYCPMKKFGGHMECYNISVANEIIFCLTELNDVQRCSTKRTVTVNDTVDVTVTDTVTNKKRAKALVAEETATGPTKADYEKIVEEITGKDMNTVVSALKDFIKLKPNFIEPYIDYWNLAARGTNMPQVKQSTESRSKQLKVRLKEEAFDFIEIIRLVRVSNKLKNESSWFSFDWIFINDKNYVKILEGNYQS
jgi:hypothetical protein